MPPGPLLLCLLKLFKHLDGCQNDGPFLGPLNTRCRSICQNYGPSWVLNLIRYKVFRGLTCSALLIFYFTDVDSHKRFKREVHVTLSDTMSCYTFV